LRKLTLIAGALTALAGVPVALAPSAARAQTPARIQVAVGQTDFISQDVPAIDFRGEYRSGLSLLPFWKQYFTLQPFIGIETTTKGSFWGGAGLELDWHFEHFFISPTVAIGGYHQGNGKDLGDILEFRTTMEFGWRFDNDMRLGIVFSHASNANIVHINPGTEALLVSMQVPVATLFGN
jgi:lipid A 3-O-deacylase